MQHRLQPVMLWLRGQLLRYAGVHGGINLDVLDPPSLPANAVYPERSRFVLYGFGSGFAVAIAIAIFRRRVPPAVPSPAATA